MVSNDSQRLTESKHVIPYDIPKKPGNFNELKKKKNEKQTLYSKLTLATSLWQETSDHIRPEVLDLRVTGGEVEVPGLPEIPTSPSGVSHAFHSCFLHTRSDA